MSLRTISNLTDDQITLLSVANDILPDQTNTRNLGSATASWNSEFVKSLTANSLTITGSVVNSNVVNYAGSGRNLQLSDAGGTIIATNATTIQMTIPLNATVAFPIGTKITLVQGNAAGKVLLQVSDGSILMDGSPSTSYQTHYPYDSYEIEQIAIDAWLVKDKLVTVDSSSNTFLGLNQTITGSFTGSTAVGNGARITGSRQVKLGDTQVTSVVKDSSATCSIGTAATPWDGVYATAATISALSGSSQFVISNGSSAVAPLGTGSNQAVVMNSSGVPALTGNFSIGTTAVAIGSGAHGLPGDSVTDVIAIGANAGGGMTGGSASVMQNVFIGSNAGQSFSVPNSVNNVAVGFQALKQTSSSSNANGISNTAVGALAMTGGGANNCTQNTAVGAQALNFVQGSGGNNSAVGYQAMHSLSLGTSNSALGSLTGPTVSTETQNTLLGATTDITAANTNSTALGYGAQTTASNQCMIGNIGLASVEKNSGATCTLGTATNPWTNVYASALNHVGTVTTTNAQFNSTSADQAITSASVTVPLVYGAFTEVYFADLRSTTNWTGNVTPSFQLNSSLAQTQFFNGAGAQNGFMDLQISSSLPVGVYRVDWRPLCGTGSGIITFQIKANGAGAYSTLRGAMDQYSATQIWFEMVDYFTITSAGNSCNLRWANLGTKNSSASAYAMELVNCVRVTKIG